MSHPLNHESKRRSRAKRDESIMGTNNSSIVSKRSVERLYYPEPHFFRYFVKKPQRRSPLINRGYFLRMHAIDTVVRRFLDEPTTKPKMVINLGCGYDPLPFQRLSGAPKNCTKTTFVDVDYPELMRKKCEVISQTPQLSSLLGLNEEVSSSGSILYKSPHYIAIGCDLANIDAFGSILENEISIKKWMVLCTAEVSVTYMDAKAADNLITWFAQDQNNDVRFCLLEQYLPHGTSHPFAQQMLHHFDNLHTPLRSVHKYPQLSDQAYRFRSRGWDSVQVESLWHVWNDPSFLTTEQRLALNDVEPFDEWEDFVLFASHYFLLEASIGARVTKPDCKATNGQANMIGQGRAWSRQPENVRDHSQHLTLRISSISDDVNRRFGATICIRPGVVGHFGGLGTQGRVNTADFYSAHELNRNGMTFGSNSIQPRMCHTITKLSENSSLLVGGRASPDHAFSDCWLYDNGTWSRVDDLPSPVYRHSATHVNLKNGENAVLICGGRSNSKDALNAWLLWRDSTGWVSVSSAGDEMTPRFGAAMASTATNKGIILGGMTADGIICQDILQWQLSSVDTSPSVTLLRRLDYTESIDSGRRLLCRLGACLTSSGDNVLVIGGVAHDMLSEPYAYVGFPKDLDVDKTIEPFTVPWDPEVDYGYRPLLVGHSVFEEDSSVIVVGGGANCFSFGTCWNRSIVTLAFDGEAKNDWKLFNGEDAKPHDDKRDLTSVSERRLAPELSAGEAQSEDVQCLGIETAKDFERLVNNSKPVKMERMDLGSCLTNWSLDTLKVKMGESRSVVVHEASGPHMNFSTKNFVYSTKRLGQFLDQIANGSPQYLRSLSSERPSDQPAEFASDFPELAADFRLPSQLQYASQNAHSSPMRISGPVNMWLHYDVMANVLCQITGAKRVILYPPSDITHLKVPPGESSSRINIFEPNQQTHPSLASAHPQEAILRPGDVLFIPPLWPHAASPVETTSISINVFFRDLKSGYAAGRDVYGNRDVQAYEKGRKDLTRMVQSFDRLPPHMGRFYLERLAAELREEAISMMP